jgi:hypothetical protein
MGMVVFGVLLALSWGLFVFTSRYRCMSTDLVIQ